MPLSLLRSKNITPNQMTHEAYLKSAFDAQGQHFNQMDYTSYFTAQQQQLQQQHQQQHQPPYSFAALPPTPSYVNHRPLDNYQNPSPPQNTYDFQNFDAYNHFNANGVPEPPTPQSQPRNSKAPKSQDGQPDMNMEASAEARQGSNSGNEDDEENMTPAQTRRKAQNRAAQRAFRERKERHVKDLEDQLAALRNSTQSITTENERLRIHLQKVSTENEILRATSSNQPHHQNPHSIPDTIGPMSYSPKDFYREVLSAHDNKVPSHRIVVDEQSGSKLLGAGATWDFIQKSEGFKAGRIDVVMVSEMLKTVAKCDGQGPVFEEREILKAMDMCAVDGDDDLL